MRGPRVERQDEVLTPEALAFLAELHRRFGARARSCWRGARSAAQRRPTRPAGARAREPRDPRGCQLEGRSGPGLTNRFVTITGPSERKMLVDAVSSGGQVWLADFEDAKAPTWANMVGGQLSLTDAIERRIDFTTPEGKRHTLGDPVAAIVARPVAGTSTSTTWRSMGAAGWGLHGLRPVLLPQRRRQLAKGSGPYFYLPKMESHLRIRTPGKPVPATRDAHLRSTSDRPLLYSTACSTTNTRDRDRPHGHA